MGDVRAVKNLDEAVVEELSDVVVGKVEIIRLLVVALLSKGHVLLEGVPGVAKTLIAKAFAKSLDLNFRRIQFTPDMLPSDIVGTFVFNQKNQDFVFREGPVFANVILADEINRATPKTQSALLEAMQERQVTVEGFTKKVKEPFLVIATQNPVEHEGTYPLPEAQLDRFMFRLIVGYPVHEEGVKILEESTDLDLAAVQNVVRLDEVQNAIDVVQKEVHTSRELLDYIVSVVEMTRDDRRRILLGGSPRSSVHLRDSSKSLAAIKGRDYVVPDDVKELVFHVLNHRILLSPDYLVESASVNKPYQYDDLRIVLSDALLKIQPPR